jgi:Gp157 protein
MNAKFLFNDAQAVRAQISAMLIHYPDLADDAELMADMIEGSTDLHRILERALNARQEALTMATAIKEREAAMSERRARYERQADGIKKIMQMLMESAGQDKVTLPEATLSITKARETVNIIDVDQLPQGFFRTERKADKKAILEAFKDGGHVPPGAEIAMGECGLTVRTK